TVNVIVPPRVIGVYARGAAWNSNYWSYLASQGDGDVADPSLGYLLSVGVNQLRTLAWSNIDTISVRFSEGVTIGQSDLTVVNAAGVPSINGFSWNAGSSIATWTFASALDAGK